MADLVSSVRRLSPISEGRRTLALLVLVIGIVSTSAIFAAIDGVWLRPIPFLRADELAVVSVASGTRRPNTVEISEAAAALAMDPRVAMAAWARESPDSERTVFDSRDAGIFNYAVTPSFFRVLGVAPFRGRTFTEEETSEVHGIIPGLISYSLWQGRWGGSDDVLGRTVQLQNLNVEVVGILPPGFAYPFGASMWTPLSDGRRTPIPSIVRLREGTSVSVFARAYPSLDILPAERVLRPERHAAVTLVAAGAGLLLLAICVSLLSLRAAEAARRRHVAGIRLSLGATQKRLWGDAVLHTAIQASTALALAWLLVPALSAAVLARVPAALTRHADALPTWRTVAWSVLVALAGAAAYHWPVRSPGAVARQIAARGWRTGTRASMWRTTVLVAAGTTIAYLAVLATLNAAAVAGADLGFDATGVLYVSQPPLRERPDAAASAAGTASRRPLPSVLDLRRIEGVASAAIATTQPLTRFTLGGTARAPDNPECEPESVRLNMVSVDYFETLGMAPLDGLTYDPALPPSEQAIVSRALASKWSACGFSLGDRVQATSWRGHVVGVVADAVYADPRDPPEPQVYFLRGEEVGAVLLARSADQSAAGMRALRERLGILFPGLSVGSLRVDAARIRSGDVDRAILLQSFSGLAVFLVCVGMAASQSSLIRSRQRELALRSALGARPWHLVALLLEPALIGALVGVIAGLTVGAGVGRAAEVLFFGVAGVNGAALLAVGVAGVMVPVAIAMGGAPGVLRIPAAVALHDEV